jgi:hypothetical protein
MWWLKSVRSQWIRKYSIRDEKWKPKSIYFSKGLPYIDDKCLLLYWVVCTRCEVKIELLRYRDCREYDRWVQQAV